MALPILWTRSFQYKMQPSSIFTDFINEMPLREPGVVCGSHVDGLDSAFGLPAHEQEAKAP